MLSYVRRKLSNMVAHHNIIDDRAQFHRSAYCSGSMVYGDVNAGEGCKIFRAHIEGKVTIGRFSSLWGPGIHVIGRMHGIQIGSFCSISRFVSIQEDNHNVHRTTTYFLERNVLGIPEASNAVTSKGAVTIGNDVWIGAGAQILSGVSVGHGAVIGAGAIVTKDIPPYAIAVGNPARVARYRFCPETIQELLQKSWWDWPLDRIRENREFLLKDRA